MPIAETWKVEGMSCGGCEASVRRVLADAPGLLAVSPDHCTDEVKLELDPSLVDRDEIARRIERAGFDVVGR
jgi:copper chaperone CopZ